MRPRMALASTVTDALDAAGPSPGGDPTPARPDARYRAPSRPRADASVLPSGRERNGRSWSGERSSARALPRGARSGAERPLWATAAGTPRAARPRSRRICASELGDGAAARAAFTRRRRSGCDSRATTPGRPSRPPDARFAPLDTRRQTIPCGAGRVAGADGRTPARRHAGRRTGQRRRGGRTPAAGGYSASDRPSAGKSRRPGRGLLDLGVRLPLSWPR
jgi:hypothetical protein